MADHTRKKRPRDANQLGKMIVDISVGEVEDCSPPKEDDGKLAAAVEHVWEVGEIVDVLEKWERKQQVRRVMASEGWHT
jgi:hypothetical protein